MAVPVRLGSRVVSSWAREVGLSCAGASFCEGVSAGGAETVRLRLGRTVVPAGLAGAAPLIGPAGPVELVGIFGIAGVTGRDDVAGNVGVDDVAGRAEPVGMAGMAALVGMVGKLALVGPVGPVGPVGDVIVVRGAPDLPMSHCKAASSSPCERANTSKL